MEKRGFVTFFARIHIEYFHLGIFVTLGVCLIRKYGSRNTAFFSVFQCFSGYRVASLLWRYPRFVNKFKIKGRYLIIKLTYVFIQWFKDIDLATKMNKDRKTANAHNLDKTFYNQKYRTRQYLQSCTFNLLNWSKTWSNIR